ncbi:GDSL-type esterase/lipase family protein [Pontibacter sp. BT731]|uniref:SGNH/GDSL hydrolase family protein n=1 Tax=Pontibacter coccineus TaxID=3063328 RepID=UPI0026E48B05|nr:SGNH/GDSL hydrolase family protein [Pontibacter sp. BT731]MDO6392240.1 GDSL-type esterase/lipase family protein [Pontibacter sp. BT731]
MLPTAVYGQADLTSKVRIMPLGDSNTEGVRSIDVAPEDRVAYRDKLEELLDASSWKGQYEFVGSESGGSAHMRGTAHAGFGGARDEDIATLLKEGKFRFYDTDIYPGPGGGPYLDQYAPDIILLHIGTNWIDASPEAVRDVADILDQVDLYEQRAGKEVTVILAKIILTDGGNPTLDAATRTYNAHVEAMVEERLASGDKLVLVDMQDGVGLVYRPESEGGDMADQLHPNQQGYRKMAQVWFEALSPIVPLPVELTSFTGTLSKVEVLLEWTTASELDNGYFQVERMQEGQPFSPIGRVDGNGTSSLSHRYSFRDKSAPAGLLYYRLRQVDTDGTYSYSKVVAVHRSVATDFRVRLYPTLSDGSPRTVHISATGFAAAALVDVTLRDTMGRRLHHQTLRARAQGELEDEVQLPLVLSKGLYMWEVSSSDKTSKVKLLVR